MEDQAVIQVLEKKNFTKQHLLSVPISLPRIGPSTARVKTSMMSLSTNSTTYALYGDMLGWYDIHVLPADIPHMFSDSTKYGRISSWGYAQVIESTFAAAPVGSFVFGYLPIGTLPVDLVLESVTVWKTQAVDTSPHRQQVMPIYNRYQLLPSPPSNMNSQAYDSVMQVLFETSYNLNRGSFAFDGRKPFPPLGVSYGRLGPATQSWTQRDAHISNAAVVLLAASGKTALSFAHQLRHARPSADQPDKIIGVTSASSKAFVVGTGFYDRVLLYDDINSPGVAESVGRFAKVILGDFGGRGSATSTWLEALKSYCKSIVWLGVGGESKLYTPEEMAMKQSYATNNGMLQVNASGMRDSAMQAVGEEKYWEEFLPEWNRFKEMGGIPGLTFNVGSGMDDVGKVWDQICTGGFKPNEGYVFEL